MAMLSCTLRHHRLPVTAAAAMLLALTMTSRSMAGEGLRPSLQCCAPQAAQAQDVPSGASATARHRAFLSDGVPLKYRNRISPYPAVVKVIRAGGVLYREHCATCHGLAGRGDGAAGSAIVPPPAFLSYTVKRARAGDEYMLWTISEGGLPFGTDMPAFKDILTKRQIWQIVEYMRAGFPSAEQVDGE